MMMWIGSYMDGKLRLPTFNNPNATASLPPQPELRNLLRKLGGDQFDRDHLYQLGGGKARAPACSGFQEGRYAHKIEGLTLSGNN